MAPYLKVAEQLLISRIISNGFPISGKTKAGLGLSALSAFLMFIGFGFLLYAAHLYFTNNYTPDIAAALTGFLAFGLAGMSGLISLAILQHKKAKAEKFKEEIQEKITHFIEAANDSFGVPIAQNPKTAVTAASLIGFMVGNRF